MRILGLDHGSHRIGVAISDDLRMIAQPLEFVKAQPPEIFGDRLAALCLEYRIELIVVGMPRNMDGSHGPAAERVVEFLAFLRASTDIPVRTWDERLSSVQANRALRAANIPRDKRKGKVDQVAAAILLQSYLDSRAGGGGQS